jgi:outer membrane lipoprotein-sorting protein
MVKAFSIFLVSAVTLLEAASLGAPAEPSGKEEILAVVHRMVSVFEKMEDFTCETEVTYYEGGIEDQQWRVKFFFKKGKKFRVDFSHPFKGMSVFYKGGDEELTVRPLSFLPALKLRLSIDNPIAKTPSGQRIDQTDVAYFIRFIFKNLKSVEQRENEFQDDGQRIQFLFWALDYIEGEHLEKYRVFVSRENWFPMRVERHNPQGDLVELIVFKNFVINAHLEDELFLT